MEKLYQEKGIQIECGSVSSAAGFTSRAVNMENCDEVTFIVSYGQAAAALNSVLQAVQSADVNLSTNATLGSSQVIGSTNATIINNAKEAIITVSSAATDGNTIIINGTTLTCGTAVSATGLVFGATAGTTVATTALYASLSTMINALANISAAQTSADSSSIRVSVDDTASTWLTIGTTGAAPFPILGRTVNNIITVRADMLDSTSKYVGVTLSSVGTAVNIAVATIKSGMRYKTPPTHISSTAIYNAT